MRKSKPVLEQYFVLPNPGLRDFLARTVSGKGVDYRTPFGNKAPREEVLASGDKIFDDGSREQPSGMSSLFELEKENRSKVGPLSYMVPLEERLESIELYFTGAASTLPIPEATLNKVVEEWQAIKGIRLRSVDKTIENMKLSTNSGSPFFTKRKLVVNQSGDLRPEAKDLIATLGGRGQEGGPLPDDVKQRDIGMYPFSVNVQEARLYQPFVAGIQKHGLMPAYVSNRQVDETVTRLFDTKSKDDLVVVTDFTKMDHHFNVGMQESTKYILKALTSNGVAEQEWFDQIYPLKYNLPIILSEKLMISGPHGMGSGSTGTNLDESVAHRALQYQAASDAGEELNKYSQYLGDDGMISYPGITVEQIVDTYSRYGMIMNPEKQTASSEYCLFLRRGHHTNYRINGIMVGVYPTYRALGRLLGQERYYDPRKGGPEAVTLRAGSILENCNTHPLFERLVDFVMKGDKYRLGLDIPGFIENISAKYAEAKAELPEFMSYTQTISEQQGITSWRIYRYLTQRA